MRGWRSLALGVAFFLGGCADNAVFDIEIQLPPGTGAAYVDVRPEGTVDFDASWGGSDAFPRHRFTLNESQPTMVLVSVVAESIEQDALAQIHFCPSERVDCAGADTVHPVSCIRFQRPFHRGLRSIYRSIIGAAPPTRAAGAPRFCSEEPRVVTPCEIACSDGEWHDVPAGGFCIEGPNVCDR